MREPGCEPIYEVADLFRERCLVNDRSLLWPEISAWTLDNISTTNGFLDMTQSSSGGYDAFMTKWGEQLADQPKDIHRIGVDALAFYHLFPTDIGYERKIDRVKAALAWKLADEAPDLNLLQRAYSSGANRDRPGIGNAGAQYLIAFVREITFYVEFAKEVRTRKIDPHDRPACQEIADALQRRLKNTPPARNILLHILFPDYYERISNVEHKESIREAFEDLSGGAQDPDEAIFRIRQKLSERYGKTFDFYRDPEIKEQWWPDSETDNEQGIWIFQANSSVYDIRGAIISLRNQTWLVSEHSKDISVGDRVYLWQSGANEGVVGGGKIIDEVRPRPIAEAERPFIKDMDKFAGDQPRVNIQIDFLVEPILSRREILEDQRLRELSILKMPRATNFRVRASEASAIEELLGPRKKVVSRPPAPPENYVEASFAEIAATVKSQGLSISDRMLRRYQYSLSTRGFVILSGVSGTGKTWLTEAYAKAVGAKYLLVPVAPNWTTNEDLLGYFNPVNSTYNDTAFSRFLRETSKEYQLAMQKGVNPKPCHVVLDEMNLARVEYYFAKFLSAMEIRMRSGAATIELSDKDQVLLPANLCAIGTVNIDETTHGFSDKVFDRAQVIELEAPRKALEARTENSPFQDDLLQIWDAIHDVAPFAFRIVDEIKKYVATATNNGGSWQDAFDEQLLQKVLPKLKGADLRLGGVLEQFSAITRSHFPLSNEKAQRMLNQFNEHGFASYF